MANNTIVNDVENILVEFRDSPHLERAIKAILTFMENGIPESNDLDGMRYLVSQVQIVTDVRMAEDRFHLYEPAFKKFIEYVDDSRYDSISVSMPGEVLVINVNYNSPPFGTEYMYTYSDNLGTIDY